MMIGRCRLLAAFAVLALLAGSVTATAQIDERRAETYFKEAAALCERDAGRLWGVSLCGPIVFSDPITHAIATNRPAPTVKPPVGLGFANAAVDWDGTRWTTLVWPWIPSDAHERARLLLHELFHRVQPQLGLLVADGQNDHLDTLEGRYWLQLEWRALARALAASGADRSAAIADALAFRLTRRARFADAADAERRLEINEGLAQYTGTVAPAASGAAAAADAIDQLTEGAKKASFVRTFAYASGPAYGVLLDASSADWRHRIKADDDLGQLLMRLDGVRPAADPIAAAARYDGSALRTLEEARDAEQKAALAAFRRRFVDGPVLILPGARNFTFSPNGVTPLPGAGTVYATFGATDEWGRLEAATVLVSADRRTLRVPAPRTTDGSTLSGDGWTLHVAPGWVVRPGRRHGDVELVREEPRNPIE